MAGWSRAGTAGAMLGNILWYLAARALGIQRLEPIIHRWGRWMTMSWAEVKRAERWFALHGTFFVFLGRLLPTVRSLVSIPAGLLKMRFRSFRPRLDPRHRGWTALLAGAGYKLGENYTDIDKMLGPASNAILVVLVAGLYLARVDPSPHAPIGEKIRIGWQAFSSLTYAANIHNGYLVPR